MFKAFPPAKINLFLKVLGKRENGLHELETLLAFTDLKDDLSIEILKQVQDDGLTQHSHPELVSGSKITITGPFAHLVDPKNNIFNKILDYFVDKFAIDRNLHIKLVKNIPVGAGLGGGSSNAASFMMGLNEIFQLNLSRETLQKTSLEFGSDIAFFFENQASIIKGRGDIISNYPTFEPILAILVNPKIHLSTAQVFQSLNQNYSKEIATEKLLKTNIINLAKLPNDLENSAIAIVPEIKNILDEIKNSGAQITKMSGSGASCFGIFATEENLKKAEENLIKKFPNYFVKKVKILANV